MINTDVKNILKKQDIQYSRYFTTPTRCKTGYGML